MEALFYSHYIRIDEKSRIIDGFSSAFIHPKATDILLTDQGGYQFRLHDGGVENPVLLTTDGIPVNKWNGSQVIPRTEAEIQADREALPPAPPSRLEKLERRQANADAAIRSIMGIISKLPIPGGGK